MGAGSGVGWGQGAAAWHGHAHALVNGGGPSEQEVGLSQRECLPFCRILIFYTPTSYLPLTAILSALSVCAPLSGRVGCAELQECKTLLLQTIMCLLQTSPAANQPFPPLHIDPPSYTVQRGRRRWAAGRERPHRPCGAGGTVAAEPRRGTRRYIQDTGHGERGGEGRGSFGKGRDSTIRGGIGREGRGRSQAMDRAWTALCTVRLFMLAGTYIHWEGAPVQTFRCRKVGILFRKRPVSFVKLHSITARG